MKKIDKISDVAEDMRHLAKEGRSRTGREGHLNIGRERKGKKWKRRGRKRIGEDII